MQAYDYSVKTPDTLGVSDKKPSRKAIVNIPRGELIIN
jgi:hypothetical protein